MILALQPYGVVVITALHPTDATAHAAVIEGISFGSSHLQSSMHDMTSPNKKCCCCIPSISPSGLLTDAIEKPLVQWYVRPTGTANSQASVHTSSLIEASRQKQHNGICIFLSNSVNASRAAHQDSGCQKLFALAVELTHTQMRVDVLHL